MRRAARLSALGAGLLALASAGNALAFCRTSSCPKKGPSWQVCTPAEPDDCGVTLFWPSACVGFSVQKDASQFITFAQTEQVLTAAFATWMSAPCPGGGTPVITVTEAAPADCRKHEYNQMKANANVVLFQDTDWPYENSANTLALTTVTYNLDTGEIYDADMELNTADIHFTVGDTNVDFDMLSVVTHETGHFLGLAHSHDSSATMWPSYDPPTTNLRHLSADDIAGICAIYPPGDASPCCDATPRHGFSSLCGADQTGAQMLDAGTTCAGSRTSSSGGGTGGCCAVAPGSTSSDDPYAGAAAALGALLLAARSRRRSSREGRDRPRPRAR
jgi:MYXO-CTERM domain-containing protein